MKQKDPFHLLFKAEFGAEPLFKNQTHLALELLNNPDSHYFMDPDSEERPKALSRLKAYISQLFSPEARRSVNEEFRVSLENILNDKKILTPNYSAEEITNDIIEGLKSLNKSPRTNDFTIRRSYDLRFELYERL